MAAVPVNHGGAPQEWRNSLWDCFSPGGTCFMSCCCPCIVFGKNHERLKDPQGPEQNGINGSCCAWLCLAYFGCQWIVQMNERGEFRRKYNLAGSGMTDCATAYCCACCELIQTEKEGKFRADEARGLMAGGYQKTEGMNYQSPA